MGLVFKRLRKILLLLPISLGVGCAGPYVPTARIVISAPGPLDQRLPVVDRIATEMGFVSVNPARINAELFPRGDIAAVLAYRYPELPDLHLRAEIYPHATGGPYSGEERWFYLIYVDVAKEGVEFRGKAREVLIKLLTKLRVEFGSQYVRGSNVWHPDDPIFK